MNATAEPKPLYGALTVYRERGAYLRRREQFELALAAYDSALACAPDDLRLLMGRSQVGIDAVQPQQALADAERALALAPANPTSRYVRTRALYAMSEFERSTALSHRGARTRKMPPYFREGVSMGEATIQNCIGRNAGNVFLDFLPIIRKMEAANASDELEPSKKLHVSRIPRSTRKKRLTQMEAYKHLTLSRVLAMKYLGPMAYDKFFLQDLLVDPRLKGANTKGNKQLKELVEEALRSLTERQEMLRSQRPYYAIQFAEKTESKHETEYKKRLLESERHINTRTVERLLAQVDNCMGKLEINNMTKIAERLQIFLDSKTPRTLPAKEHYLDRLYRTVGEGYLAQHRLSSKNEQGIRRRIAFLMNLPYDRPTSYDSVIAKYPYKFCDPKTTLEKHLKTLDMCENSYMKCWLLYEISHLLNTHRNYTLAKFYAKMCQREAQKINSVPWWLNACYMLISGEMHQGSTNEVHAQIEQAQQFARQEMRDCTHVDEFLAKCAEMASANLGVDDGQAILAREKQILKVMDDSLRDDTQVLFRRISSLPQGRRFSVLPVKSLGENHSARVKRRQRGISIVPGDSKALVAPPMSKVRGFQVFDI